MAWFKKKVDEIIAQTVQNVVPVEKEECFDIGSISRKSVTEEPSMTRIAFARLENVYIQEPIIFSGINIYQRCIKDAGFIFKSDNIKTQQEINRILTTTRFNEVFLDKAPRHLGIFGNAFIELIPNTNHTSIEEFLCVDPKSINFIRESFGRAFNSGNVKFDNAGEPEGFVQTGTLGNLIKFKNNEEMIHLHLHQINEGQMGIGLIEPIYGTATIKKNIETAMGETMFRLGFPIPIVKYGSKDVGTTPEMQKKADELAKKLAQSTTGGVSYPYIFEPSFTKTTEAGTALETNLYYLSSLESASLGIPLAIILGTSEKEGRAGLDALLESMEFSIRGMMECLRPDFVMKTVLEKNGFTPDFDFQWNPLLIKSMKEKVMRVKRYAQANLIKNDRKLRNWIRTIEGLPLESEEEIEDIKQPSRSKPKPKNK